MVIDEHYLTEVIWKWEFKMEGSYSRELHMFPILMSLSPNSLPIMFRVF